jgi:hypothetical protein
MGGSILGEAYCFHLQGRGVRFLLYSRYRVSGSFGMLVLVCQAMQCLSDLSLNM